MPESSVDSYINAQPEEVMSFNDWWSSHGGNNENPYSAGNKFFNAFTGSVDKAKADYDAYVSNLNNRNEYIAMQSARAWDKMMDDTKYQRMYKDYEAAGLNPYLLVNNGSVSASAPTSSKASYDVKKREQEKASGKGRDLALVLLAVARIAAALL